MPPRWPDVCSILTAQRSQPSSIRWFASGRAPYLCHRGPRTHRLLRPGEPYRAASAALARLGIDVDAWPAPPAGLFVVEERTLYLRSRGAMTVAHEFGHALDCALGGGVYRSGVDPRVRACSQKPKRS